MGWRVAAAEKNSIKGVISPDTDLKKNRRIAPKRELSCGLRLLERGKKNRGTFQVGIEPKRLLNEIKQNNTLVTEYTGIL